ncbi:PAS domain-containing protein [Beijerinckia indica]|uniref:histidine kinase n=1 Tax=Beijerinckia indica subsp. indica (strain ATCC 9039 / DSM 1715 / NCIMB 8712) TaxID=395963 RepID=B2IDG6_BEII9|nr:PAS domain-containing protein [Beijerinckia indica]ACB94018.1 multi-sensor hybrid histidine kinase [Beijerinckia indica subsp. indica ATCC 9039]
MAALQGSTMTVDAPGREDLSFAPQEAGDAISWRALADVLSAIAAVQEPRAVMKLVCRAGCALVGADGASFILREGDFCHYAEQEGLGPLWQGLRFTLRECLAGSVLAEGVPAIIPDVRRDDRAALYHMTGVESLMMIPLGAGLQPEPRLGTIGIYWACKREPTEAEIHACELLAQAAARTLTNITEIATLRDSEAKLRLVLETGRFGIFELDGATRALDASPIYKDHYGRDPHLPFTYADMISTIHPLDRHDLVTGLDRATMEGVIFDQEYRLVTADGDLRRLHVHAHPIRDARGRSTRLVGASLDITERYQAECILQANERRMQLAQDAALVGTWEWDMTTHDVVCSPEQSRLFGHEPIMRTLSEADFFASVHRDDRDMLKAAFGAMPRSGGFECEYRIVQPDDDIRWVVGRGRVLHDAEGLQTRLIGIMMDVTERHRAEEILRASEDRYRNLVESLPLLVWTCRPNADCDYLSPQWIAYTGRSADELLGLNWLEYVHPDDRERAEEHWRGARDDKHPYHIDYRLRRHDGVYRWFKTRGTPVRDMDGRIIYWIKTCTDIEDLVVAREYVARHQYELEHLVAERTIELADINAQLKEEINERSKVQAQLAQAQRIEAIGQVTSGVAHDFNNLLTVILGNLDLLEKSVIDPVRGDPKTKRRLDNMRMAGERGAKLTGQLLAFSRRQRLQPKPIDLNEAALAVKELLQGALGGSVLLEWNPKPDLWLALADLTQIELVLLNLAINARDAMQAGGTLIIETANVILPYKSDRQMGEPVAAGEYVVLAVTDSGCGMSESVKARVFEPFFTTKPIGKGSGLGLPQVYGFATQSGGGVTIDTQEGVGTTVKVYLPRAMTPVMGYEGIHPAPVENGHAQRCKPITILLVDDDNAVREVAANILTDLGYAVIEAGSGSAALERLEEMPQIDLLLVDFAMPGMNGVELARVVRERLPNLPILFVTGYADLAEIKNVGEDRIVQKPFERQGLAAKVSYVLERGADTHVYPARDNNISLARGRM